MDVNYTYSGDHFPIYMYIESLCCIPKINLILYINFWVRNKYKKNRIDCLKTALVFFES